MIRSRNKQKSWSRGDTFITSLVFLFVMIGTLRLCTTKTMHEAKLTNIFVQETQGFYLLENLMHLARDYVYQIVQNPREPHLFLGASAFRIKDKLNEGTKYVIDFNNSLAAGQLIPRSFWDDSTSSWVDFPLQIDSFEIKGGPIFWKDNKKDSNDERYLAEVFMVGSLNLISNLIPNWTMRTVQTMEIERNPLCDFQLYAEGDITINTNICANTWYTQIDKPVQINGNARFSDSTGEGNNSVTFYDKFNCAGYALHMDGTSIEDYILPKKYHMHDNHENYMRIYGNGTCTYHFNKYATNYGSTSTVQLPAGHNNFNKADEYDSYERYMFNTYWGNFNTRSRVYRPIGFDPSNYWGFWDASATPSVSNTVDQDEHVLNYCFGFHNLAQSSTRGGHGLYARSGANNYSPEYAMSQLRGLNSYQMTEKARLVEMQKPINFPCLLLEIILSGDKNNKSFYVPNNFIFSTYKYDAFPAFKDNIYLNRYLNLAFQNNSIIGTVDFLFYKLNNTGYKYDFASAPTACIASSNMYMDISSNKSAFHSIQTQAASGLSIDSIAKKKSNFSPSGHGDDNCPPDKIVDNGTYWGLSNYITRITGDHYNFIYDRNRAKWIQLVDVDIGALTTALNADETWNSNSVMPIIAVNTWWQGKDASRANKNYQYDGKDIRHNYSTNRENFFTNYRDGSYIYPDNLPPVIDIGVRLINATTLPEKGLTFYCPYPLYIKGDFNTNVPKPALLITDSLTLLPTNWQDWRSQMDPILSHLWYNGSSYTAHPFTHGTTIYADIITGRTHPHFYIQTADVTGIGTPNSYNTIKQNEKPNPDLGIHDAFRSLCDFSDRVNFHGSLMLPYFCQEQWEPPINFCKTTTEYRDPSIHSHPNLNMSPRVNAGIPAAMPFYYRINRGRKTHCIGDAAYNALSGDTLYNKDWFSGSFSDYHAALPNYLKYEVAP